MAFVCFCFGTLRRVRDATPYDMGWSALRWEGVTQYKNLRCVGEVMH